MKSYWLVNLEGVNPGIIIQIWSFIYVYILHLNQMLLTIYINLGNLCLVNSSSPLGSLFISTHSSKVWWEDRTEHQPLWWFSQFCWHLSSLCFGSRIDHLYQSQGTWHLHVWHQPLKLYLYFFSSSETLTRCKEISNLITLLHRKRFTDKC